MTRLLCLLSLVATLVLTGPLAAAVYCVRVNATGIGDGSTWESAYREMPKKLVRGDVYYVARGVYKGFTFDTPDTGALFATIKKATEADHGTDIDWRKEYGEGPAVFGPLVINQGRLMIDGATGIQTRDYGFEVTAVPGNVNLVTFGPQVSYVNLNCVNIHCTSRNAPANQANGIYSPDGASGVSMTHCYIHDIPGRPFLVSGWDNFLLEHSWIARNRSTAALPAQGLLARGGNGFIIRYNIWEDIEGTAVIANLGQPAKNWDIYGNVFFQSGEAPCRSVSDGIVATGDNKDSTLATVKFYNNTMANITGNAGLRLVTPISKGALAFDNLFYHCPFVEMVNVMHDYNTFVDCDSVYDLQGWGAHSEIAKGNPFVDLVGKDFRLMAATAAGYVMPFPYNTDLYGKTRGSDGVWDRGACEYLKSSAPTGYAGR
jgi:hypothetical protein